MEDLFTSLWFNALIAFLSLTMHILSKWGEYRDEVAPVGLAGYFNARPVRTLMSFTGTMLMFLLAMGMNWLNPLMSVTIGWFNSSLVDNAANRGKQMMG